MSVKVRLRVTPFKETEVSSDELAAALDKAGRLATEEQLAAHGVGSPKTPEDKKDSGSTQATPVVNNPASAEKGKGN